MREQPNRANDFFVGLEVPWGQDWETSYSNDCESFLVVTYNSGLPYTSATWIEKDDDGDWHIVCHWSLQEHEVPKHLELSYWYFGMAGILQAWRTQLGHDNPLEGYEILPARLLVEEPVKGLFYITPTGCACPECVIEYATVEALENNDISIILPLGEELDANLECDFCGAFYAIQGGAE